MYLLTEIEQETSSKREKGIRKMESLRKISLFGGGSKTTKTENVSETNLMRLLCLNPVVISGLTFIFFIM